MKSTSRMLVLLLAVVLAAPLALAAGPGPGKDVPKLTEKEITVLLDTAAKVRTDLAEVRRLRAQPDRESWAQAAAAQKRVRENMEKFLAVTGLTAEELVRMMDASGLDNGKVDDEKPEFRVLEREHPHR